MTDFLRPFKERFYRYRAIHDVKAHTTDLKAWINLIDVLARQGVLNAHELALVEAHQLSPTGHAFQAFSTNIIEQSGEALNSLSRRPKANIGKVIDLLIKWKTVAQCGYTHDVSKGYFTDAEPHMQAQWDEIIYPLVKESDFSKTLDLACGHGRNSEFLRRHARELYMVDINASCIRECQSRFGTEKDGCKFFYYTTVGNNVAMIGDNSLTLVYSWDSMVHFDKLVMSDYVTDIARVLCPGGTAFLHHSNYGSLAPDSDWATNPGTRSDMSGELMKEFAESAGLLVVSQHIQGRAERRGLDGLDCVSILLKPRAGER